MGVVHMTVNLITIDFGVQKVYRGYLIYWMSSISSWYRKKKRLHEERFDAMLQRHGAQDLEEIDVEDGEGEEIEMDVIVDYNEVKPRQPRFGCYTYQHELVANVCRPLLPTFKLKLMYLIN